MKLKTKIENEKFYWDKQIERHHIAKRVRNLARNFNVKPYNSLAKKLNVSRKTIWALANGLTIPSQDFITKLQEIENGLSGKGDRGVLQGGGGK